MVGQLPYKNTSVYAILKIILRSKLSLSKLNLNIAKQISTMSF